MKRFAQRLRRHRSRRWPEETHVMIAGAITITLIFGLVFGAAKLGAPANGAAPSSTEGARK